MTLGAAVGVFGFVFGVGAVAAGGSVAQACVMSLLVFTGASQFSAVSVVAAGGSDVGRARAERWCWRRATPSTGWRCRGSSPDRWPAGRVAAQLTIDESTAMASAQADPAAKRHAFWITGIAVYVCWNVATLVGALIGSAIEPATYGLDVAFPAGFVAMVAPHLRHRLGLIAAVLGGTICLVLIPFTPVGVPILCAVGGRARRAADADAAHPDDLPDEPVLDVSWALVLWLAAGAYAFKFLGLVVIGSRPLPAALDRCLALVPAALLSALVVQGTVSTGQDLVIDERVSRASPSPSCSPGAAPRSSSSSPPRRDDRPPPPTLNDWSL